MNELNETDQEGLAGMPAGEMTEEDSASVVMPEPDEVSSTNIMGEETATEMPTGELAGLDNTGSFEIMGVNEDMDTGEMPLGEMEEAVTNFENLDLSDGTEEMPLGEMSVAGLGAIETAESNASDEMPLGEMVEPESSDTEAVKLEGENGSTFTTEIKGTLKVTFTPS
jgi:hypothetical protein